MYKLAKYLDNVYLVEFEKPYELAMTFLRYQEFYECLNDDFRGKQFTLLQFIDWYVKDVNEYDSFSYHLDWFGFNIPSTIIEEVINLGILDENHYDLRMLDIYSSIREIQDNGNFYLIGTSTPLDPEDTTLNHEAAHGLYYTNEEYHNKMNESYELLSPESKLLLTTYLTKMGYPDKVHVDEVQAYLSTDSLLLNAEISQRALEFKQILSEYLIKI